MFMKYFSLVLGIFLLSCTSNSPTEIHVKSRNKVINVYDKVVEIPMEEVLISGFANICLQNEFLIIKDSRAPGKQIHLFDKNTFKHITSTTYIGQGPNEITNLLRIVPDGKQRRFFAVDGGKRKLFSFDLDSLLVDSNYVFKPKYNLLEDYAGDFIYINDTLFIAKFLDIDSKTNRFEVYTGQWNMDSGKFTKGYDNPLAKKKRFTFCASEELGLYVSCYSRYDLMTICNFDGSLKYNVYGPNWNEDITNTCHYSMEVCFVKDKIFAAYSGEDHRSREFHPTQIHVYSTEGEYIKTLKVGYHITGYCYDKENHRLILDLNDDIQFGYLDLEGII